MRTGSQTSISSEAIENLPDDGPDYFAWNDPPNPIYGEKIAPSYNTMYANYPKNESGGDLPANQVYQQIGGNIYALYQSDPVGYRNACALRISKALNNSGINIPYIPQQTVSGADGKYYFLSSAHLYNYVKQIFKNARKIVLTGADGGTNGTQFREKLKSIKGLYILQPNRPSRFEATGHATLWTGTMAIGGYDFFNADGGVAKITVWELP